MTTEIWFVLSVVCGCAALAIHLVQRAKGRRQTVYVACQWCGQSVPVTLTSYTHPTKRVVADRLSFADLHAHIWKHIEWWRDT